ncbi:hypothetical protein HPB50_000815 [Hyalomma asiaticum]|uniref:Uncharacterized protein n=1 Tax=Hyalomma asiaticum TaxID=266040 RepID=A0ACB7SNT6_HYAAI|nr:hypothetical protein HPB50_000815 [Hyalomma asiaticum]
MEHHDSSCARSEASSLLDQQYRTLVHPSGVTVRRITADTTKYHHMAANIPPATASKVLAPPAEDAHRVLKETLIHHLTPLEPQCLQQLLHEAELGDRRPSQLLHHMHQLASSTTSLDSQLVQEPFL